tara:strand:+ start:922 stop:1128 length:207 start_codon:yes stop_codon:yes gene_type:complete
MSYQEKCEQLYKDNGLMKDTLKTIRDMNIDITSGSAYVRDLSTIKSLIKTILAVVGEDTEKEGNGTKF